MKRILGVIAFVCLAVPAFAGTIPLTGTIRQPNGNLLNGSIQFTLNYSAARDTCSDNIVVASVVTFIVSNGALPSSARITPNDCLSPTRTTYTARYFSATGQAIAQNVFYIQGASYNLGTAVPSPLTTSNISFGTFTGLDNITVKVLNNVRYCNLFDGATVDRKIQAAHDDLPSTGGEIICNVEGSQPFASTVTISKPTIFVPGKATFAGAASPFFTVTAAFAVQGAFPTTFQQSGSTTNTIFNVATVAPFVVSGVTFYSADSQTGGAAIAVTGNGSAANSISIIKNNIFHGQWIGVDAGRVSGLRVAENQMQNERSRGVRLNNTGNGDEGDNYIFLNAFGGPDPFVAGTKAIEHIAGGGLMVHSNKFFLHDYGYQMNWNTSANSSQVSLINNNFEAQSTGGAAMSFTRTAGTISGISIIGNFGSTTSAGYGNFVDIPANATLWLAQMVVANNNVNLDTDGIAFNVVGFGAAQSSWTGNHIFGNGGTSQGFKFGANMASVHVWGNQVLGPGLADVFTSGLRGNYEPDKIGLGIPPTTTLTDRISMPNNNFIVFRDAANTQFYQAIGLDSSDNLTLSGSNRPVVTGTGAFTAQGTVSSTHYLNVPNCSDSAGDAACGASTIGTVVVDASDTATVVNTTSVTANSEIFLQIDASLGTRLGVTCNTQAASAFNPRVTARTASTSFTITVDAGPTTNPLCLSFMIIN